MKQPSFQKYVKGRDQQEPVNELFGFGKKDPNAPGWLSSQDDKNKWAANQGVTKALPAFLKAMEKLAGYATVEKAAQMGQYIVKLGQADTNNFLNKPIANTKGDKAPLAQWLKTISTKFQQDLFHGTAFKNYDEFKKALQAVKAVEEQHKLAYQRFAKNMQMVAAGLKQTVAKEHGPEAMKRPGAPALDTTGAANVAAQKQGIGSKIGSGIGRLFGR